MKVVFHQLVYSDLAQIMTYYEGVAGSELAEDFYDEFLFFVHKAAAQPEIYQIRGARNLRRVNLKRFPYHFLFRIVDGAVRILVVRHHRRDPSLGTKRI